MSFKRTTDNREPRFYGTGARNTIFRSDFLYQQEATTRSNNRMKNKQHEEQGNRKNTQASQRAGLAPCSNYPNLQLAVGARSGCYFGGGVDLHRPAVVGAKAREAISWRCSPGLGLGGRPRPSLRRPGSSASASQGNALNHVLASPIQGDAPVTTRAGWFGA